MGEASRERASSDPAAALRSGVVRLTPGDVPWLVIADLHLDPLGDGRVDAFVDWLEELPSGITLLVLGDLFDVWVGPSQGRLAGSAAVLAALARLTERSSAVHLVPGNRDFLLGPRFEQVTGARVHAHGFVLEDVLRGTAEEAAVLFVHGDELCTLDHAYQRMKRVLRSSTMRWLAPRLPLSLARWAAGRIRRTSALVVPQKPPEERSIQRDAVVEVARVAGAGVVCCGHAHEFRDEQLSPLLRWIVLDAWGGPRDCLRLEGGGILSGSHGDLLRSP